MDEHPKTITLEEAKNLSYRTVLHHVVERNADGTPQRWRVNGKPKTWKTRPDEVRVPLKYGLRGHGYLTEHDLDDFALSAEDAEAIRVDRKFPDGEFMDWVHETLEEV